MPVPKSPPIPGIPGCARLVWIGCAVVLAWGMQSLLGNRPGTPVLTCVLATQALGWLAFAWVARNPEPKLPHLAWPIAFRLVAALSPPLLEDDWARYLWDGWLLLESGSPYGIPPEAFFQDQTVPGLLQQRLSEINHPNLPTIYGPTLQIGFALSAWIAPGALWPWKLLTLGADLAVLLIIRSGVGLRAAVLYGWCPLAIHESVVNVHADILAILPMVAAWHATRRNRWILAGLFLGIAASGKVFAFAAFPFLLGFRRPAAWAVAGLSCLALHLPFWMQDRTATSLSAFAQGWEFNSSLVGILGSFLPPFWARLIPLFLVLPVIAALWLRHDPVHDHPPLHHVFGLLFVASAVVNPWYLLWMLPFAAASPSCVAPWAAMAAVPISYATVLNLGISGPGPYSHPAWVRPVEYGIIFAVALFEWIRKSKKGVFPVTPESTPHAGSTRE